MLIVEDQDKVTVELCELLALEGLRAVIKSGKVIYFEEEGTNNGKC